MTVPTNEARAVLAKAKARTARVSLVLDGELTDQVEQLGEALLEANAHHGADSIEVQEIAEQIIELEAAMKAAEVGFVFRGMGRGRWRKMEADHPPTDAQRAAGEDFDDDFPFEAMAECLVSPRLTVGDLKDLHETVLDEVQYHQLWSACRSANLGFGASRPEFDAARSILQSVRPKSAPPSASVSAEASS